WLPPAQKSNHSPSMGYDPYDYFDLGEFPQKGRVETYFGSRSELQQLILVAHELDIKVYADIVYNHKSGGQIEWNPNVNDSTYTKFNPSSGRYSLDYNNFHPSTYADSDEGSFGDFPDLAHENPATFDMLSENINWLKNEIGFDGWRFDYVKGYSPTTVKKLQASAGGYAIGEYYDGDRALLRDWLSESGPSTSVFDFPQFFTLKEMCNNRNGSFDMGKLWNSGLHYAEPERSVTFAENHDTDKDDPIVYDKMLAYAFILTHEGKPTIFWKDYFNYNLARTGQPNGIHKLMWVHKNMADGSTELLYNDKDMYVALRNGSPGLLIAINDNADSEKSVTVFTKWNDTELHAYAYRSLVNESRDIKISTDSEGKAEIVIPPRSYIVYGPALN
ncbi:MAG: alpha-amylase domain-containing protein, partial [Candidatus Halalkalibacterium sp. M3_1C_030]